MEAGQVLLLQALGCDTPTILASRRASTRGLLHEMEHFQRVVPKEHVKDLEAPLSDTAEGLRAQKPSVVNPHVVPGVLHGAIHRHVEQRHRRAPAEMQHGVAVRVGGEARPP